MLAFNTFVDMQTTDECQHTNVCVMFMLWLCKHAALFVIKMLYFCLCWNSLSPYNGETTSHFYVAFLIKCTQCCTILFVFQTFQQQPNMSFERSVCLINGRWKECFERVLDNNLLFCAIWYGWSQKDWNPLNTLLTPSGRAFKMRSNLVTQR